MRRRIATLAAAALVALPGAAVPAVAAGAGTRAEAPVERAPRLPVQVRDAEGRRVTVRDTRRIVSLNGDVTEVVFALGLGARVVGADTSSTYPAAARTLQTIGNERSLSAEGILSLSPSLVIGSTNAGPKAVIEQIRGAGVPVLILPDDERMSGVVTKIRNVARALGVPRRAARLAARVQDEIAAARAKATVARVRPRVAFLYLRGSRVQLLGGRGSRADVMIEAAGGVNVGSELGIRNFVPVTAEALVAARPDVILVPEAGLASVGGVDGLLRIPGVAQTPAGQARKVLAYDDLMLLALGPRTGKAIDLLRRGLHPELG
ncbi:MAG: ABC transporter substrate-binding protein [Actinomycetota bacterium]